MELGAEERYSLAALFTLALHDVARRGSDAGANPQLLWGQPPWLEEDAEAIPALSATDWAAYWGWDCVGPGGLCERVYTHLHIPPAKWPGLKCLPLVNHTPTTACGSRHNSFHQDRTPAHVIHSYVHVLDAELAAALPTPPRTPPPPHFSTPAVTCMGADGADSAAPSFLPASPLGSPGDTPTERKAVRDDLFEGLLSSSEDSDWEEDMRRERSAAMAVVYHHASVTSGGGGEGREGLGGGALDLADSPREQHHAPGGVGEHEGEAGGKLPCGEGEDTQHSKPLVGEQGARLDASHARPPPTPVPISPLALGSMLELVECCVGVVPAPTPALADPPSLPSPAASQPPAQASAGLGISQGSPEEALAVGDPPHAAPAVPGDGSRDFACDRRPESGDGEGKGAAIEGGRGCSVEGDREGGAPYRRPPQLRWYDSRARVALRQLSAWLQVPWPKVANFELLLANQKAPEVVEDAGGASREGERSWRRSLRWAKVGAAAVGGGALFAVTGGLAAPALAAGLGSVMTVVGGSSAVVGATTGFLASSGGAITLATTLGAAGAARTGSKMSYRTAGVSEFGFRELSQAAASPFSSCTSLAAAEEAREGAGKGGGAGGPGDAAAPGAAAATPKPSLQSSGCDGGHLVPGSSSKGHQIPGSSSWGTLAPRCQSQQTGARTTSDPGDNDSMDLCTDGSTGSSTIADALGRASLSAQGGGRPSDAALKRGGAQQQGLMQRGAGPSWARSVAEGASGREGKIPSEESHGGGSTSASSMVEGGPGAATGDLPTATPGPSSTWQRWFGRKAQGGGEEEGARGEHPKAREEQPLLSAPLRLRGTGDVKLAALICVSGWIGQVSDYVTQWEGIRSSDADAFCLVWESRELLALNSALGKLVAKQAASQGAQFAVQHFFYAGAGLLSALAPALLLDTASGLVIENAWSVGMERSAKAGKLLAAVLRERGHGDRPVTLVAHSMGARLVFHCLLELDRHNCRGVVQDVVLLGAPVGTRGERWHMARRVVAGRLVNCYSRRDWLLGVVFGGSSGFVKAAAGLCPVEVPGVENINLTAIVAGHFDYMAQLGEVLDSIALLD